jgi:hypothetical protein
LASGAAGRCGEFWRRLSIDDHGVIQLGPRHHFLGNKFMTDTPPDRMSTNPRSPHFDMEVLQRGIGIRFKGKERTDVEEYSISEGWIRVAAGKSKDRFGQPMTIKLSGEVEAWFEDSAAGEDPAASEGDNA